MSAAHMMFIFRVRIVRVNVQIQKEFDSNSSRMVVQGVSCVQGVMGEQRSLLQLL